MSETRKRVDTWYDVADRPDVWAGRSYIRPASVHVMAERDEAPTVIVSGPIVKRDGQLGTRTTSATFGRFGTPLDSAPPWVSDLAGQAAWGEVAQR